MSAFNVVRFRVKPGCEERFIDEHRKVDEVFAGMKRAALVKTGERSYCFVGEWESIRGRRPSRFPAAPTV